MMASTEGPKNVGVIDQ